MEKTPFMLEIEATLDRAEEILKESERMDQSDLDYWFSYHAPKPGQPEKYEEIRAAAKFLAQVILKDTPPGADQSAAIRQVREAVMTANAAIACHVGPKTE